jgi:hypothetical protein
MSVATIDLKIDTTYQKSVAIHKANTSWQKDIDSLLDRMNELNEYLTTLHGLLLGLTFEIERDMDGFKKSQAAPVKLSKLVRICVKMLNVVKSSDLYPGVKTTYSTLRQEISYLNELIADRKVSKDLDADEEMQDIIKATIKAAKRG